ncbi:MAG: M20/M25/M40 family metallo-hydrolase, partial [Actinomycetota bacterium]|nr:M20/M25/M40 family metallo-hydrolase [Actinomycetota bacterium]
MTSYRPYRPISRQAPRWARAARPARPRGRGLATLLLTLIAAVLLSSCGGNEDGTSAGGSTIDATLFDQDNDGLPEPGPGEPLLDRTELATAAPVTDEIARIGILNDPQIRDEESPARVGFLDRLGAPFTTTFRPQEALSTQVFAAGVDAIAAQEPEAVLLPGDIADNAQRNELEWATAVLNGERVDPDSGDPGYDGVQRADNPDPFYYRPGVDAPQQPGLLSDAQQPFTPRGLGVPWFPVLGNHDVLVQGEVPPTPELESLATGDEAVERLDEERLERLDIPPDSTLAPQLVQNLLAAQRLPGDTRAVPVDPARTLVAPREAADLLRDLIRTRSVNPPGDEQAVAELLAARAEAWGLRPRLVSVEPGRPNLILDLAGTGERPSVMLSGHSDTVPPGEAPWEHDPFSGDLVDGDVWGRGTTDMKAGVAAMLMA